MHGRLTPQHVSMDILLRCMKDLFMQDSACDIWLMHIQEGILQQAVGLTSGSHRKLDDIARDAEEEEVAVGILPIPHLQILPEVDLFLTLHVLACSMPHSTVACGR